ncbi:hypothetical protein JCM10449v2_006478 [Rhodotorula kratochvilovae]
MPLDPAPPPHRASLLTIAAQEAAWPLAFLLAPPPATDRPWSVARRVLNALAAVLVALTAYGVLTRAYELTFGLPLATTLAHLAATRGAALPASAAWGLARLVAAVLDAWVRLCAVVILPVALLWLAALLPYALGSNLVAAARLLTRRSRAGRVRLV